MITAFFKRWLAKIKAGRYWYVRFYTGKHAKCLIILLAVVLTFSAIPVSLIMNGMLFPHHPGWFLGTFLTLLLGIAVGMTLLLLLILLLYAVFIFPLHLSCLHSQKGRIRANLCLRITHTGHAAGHAQAAHVLASPAQKEAFKAAVTSQLPQLPDTLKKAARAYHNQVGSSDFSLQHALSLQDWQAHHDAACLSHLDVLFADMTLTLTPERLLGHTGCIYHCSYYPIANSTALFKSLLHPYIPLPLASCVIYAGHNKQAFERLVRALDCVFNADDTAFLQQQGGKHTIAATLLLSYWHHHIYQKAREMTTPHTRILAHWTRTSAQPLPTALTQLTSQFYGPRLPHNPPLSLKRLTCTCTRPPTPSHAQSTSPLIPLRV